MNKWHRLAYRSVLNGIALALSFYAAIFDQGASFASRLVDNVVDAGTCTFTIIMVHDAIRRMSQ